MSRHQNEESDAPLPIHDITMVMRVHAVDRDAALERAWEIACTIEREELARDEFAHVTEAKTVAG